MAHSPRSEVYESAYQSKLIPVDMQHLASGEGDADLQGSEVDCSIPDFNFPKLSKISGSPLPVAAALEQAMEQLNMIPDNDLLSIAPLIEKENIALMGTSGLAAINEPRLCKEIKEEFNVDDTSVNPISPILSEPSPSAQTLFKQFMFRSAGCYLVVAVKLLGFSVGFQPL
ncbi:hypothetical protein B0H17DRAFT_1150173 [Mycena rosella]|uniref:Uncharacterized protein n=1 Tax=Mycena rosella TaxID=1033263 RepID=A0AAD7BVA4_MYCRO|nr:hypothetical protein B0H17DRAFT_1150173 [Mycena rosella]